MQVTAHSTISLSGKLARWNYLKQEANNVAIEYFLIAHYYDKTDMRALSCSLRQLYELECDKLGAFQHKITVLKGQLKSYECRQIRGAAVHARCQRILNAEQPTCQTWEDERSHVLSKDILEIRTGDKVLNDCDLVISLLSAELRLAMFFLVTKLWDVLQVIHCARGNLQRFHRVLDTYMWGFK